VTTAVVEKRQKAQLVIRVMQAGNEIGRTSEVLELFPKPAAPTTAPANVIVIAPAEKLTDAQRQQVSAGATAIIFSPTKDIVQMFPEDLMDSRSDTGEFADLAPCAGTKLAENLQPLDLKWWARKGDWRAFAVNGSQRLKPGGKARELIRFIPPHGYISQEKVPEQYRVAMCEIPMGKGRVWICGLDLAASSEVDPVARIFADNLYRAAADPHSTDKLPTVPTHEQLLKGVK
jgi:hypothetical protein